MRFHRTSSSFALVLFALSACGGDDDAPPPGDSGMGDGGMVMPDGGGGRDGGPLVDVCTVARSVTAMAGGTVSVTGDTQAAATRPRDLGPDCGNPDSALTPPQEVIALEIPGTGPIGVRLSMVNDATDPAFYTVVQVREDCATLPTAPRTCLYETTGDEPRLTGGFTAMGGETVYLIVTGYAEVEGLEDRGPYQLDITLVDNAAPVLEAANAGYVGESFEIAIRGTDDGEIAGYQGTFLDASGAPVMLQALDTPFDNDITGMSPFTGYSRLVTIGSVRDLVEMAGATQIELRIVDEFGLTSDSATEMFAPFEGIGGACGTDTFCPAELSCETMMCAVPPAVTTACGTATDVTIATPTTTRTTATVMGTVGMGMGAMGSTCTNAAQGLEVYYTVTVPAGMFDLLATTDVASTGEMTDTVLAVRDECADPVTELACQDDIDTDGGNYRSQVEVLNAPTGPATLIVQTWNDSGGAFGLEVSLRPVLATGATCDMAGVMNRCAGGACAGGTCP